MTGPFSSVSINSFRSSLLVLPQALFLILYIYRRITRSVQVYVFKLRSRSFFTAVLCSLLLRSHRFPGVKVQLQDVLQGFTDNI